MPDATDNLITVARALQRLGMTDAVFVGGATVALHLTDTASLAPRVTLDVDLVVDAPTRHRYYVLEDAFVTPAISRIREDPSVDGSSTAFRST